jgi:hypothetical protein
MWPPSQGNGTGFRVGFHPHTPVALRLNLEPSLPNRNLQPHLATTLELNRLASLPSSTPTLPPPAPNLLPYSYLARRLCVLVHFCAVRAVLI